MKEINVAVTGGAGQISYSLLPRLISRETFGPDTKVNLRLVEIPQVVDKLEGTIMELIDCGFDQTGSLLATADIKEGVDGANWVLLVGSIPRGIVVDGKKIEERSDLLRINGGIFTDQGSAIGGLANKDAKILVVGNPANTNALIGKQHANNASQQWFAMTALDANRAKAQLALKAETDITSVTNMTIWGNHSSTQYPDLYNAKVSGATAIDNVEQDWFENDFIPTVQQRGAAIIKARGASSAASAANAAIGHMRDWALGSNDNDWVSMAVYSDGSYGVEKGLIFSFPCVCKNGDWEIVQGLELNDFSKDKLKATEKELAEERDAVSHLLP